MEREIIIPNTRFTDRVIEAVNNPKSCVTGIWYVNGKPTDAMNPDQARAVSEGTRKPIAWVDLKK